MLTSRSDIVSVGPQFAAPVCPLETRKFSVQLSRCDTLDHVHHLRWGIARRTADEQVHVIDADRQSFYLPISRLADFADQILQPRPNFTTQHLTSVARNPDKVICQSVDGMCTTSRFHTLDYRMTRLRGPFHGPHGAQLDDYCSRSPAFGGPAFLPTASGGVSSRSIS